MWYYWNVAAVRLRVYVCVQQTTVRSLDKLSDMCVIGKFICIQQSCSFIVILYLYSAWQWCMVYALIHFSTGASGRLAPRLLGRRGVTPRWHADWLHPLHLLNNTVYCFIIVAETVFVNNLQTDCCFQTTIREVFLLRNFK